MSNQDDEKDLMDAATELMQGLGEMPTPKLDAATLPIGTVMVLGGTEFKMAFNERSRLTFHTRIGYGLDEIKFSVAELQELIDRGVEFRIPEAKP